MQQERMTAGLLPRPVWLLVRPGGHDLAGNPRQREAIGPIHTLEKLKGLAEGVAFASYKPDMVEGVTDRVPDGYKQITLVEQKFEDLEKLTFEQQLIQLLWYDEDEQCWDEEKEWNADLWQDIGTLLESFGIAFPGVDAPRPTAAEEEGP